MSSEQQPTEPRSVLEPAQVTMAVGCAFTGDSRSVMYDAISEGKVRAYKEGNRTLLDFSDLKKRVAERKLAIIGKGNPKFRAMRALRGSKRKRRHKK